MMYSIIRYNIGIAIYTGCWKLFQRILEILFIVWSINSVLVLIDNQHES